MVKTEEETSGQVAKIRRSSSETEYDYLVKLVLVGDSGTGKSAIVQRFKDDVFTGEVLPTIGVDFAVKIVTLPNTGDRVKVQLWDTAGQERYRSLVPNYFRGAMGVFVVYDVTRQETADHVSQWLAQASKHTNQDPPVIVLGNKSDLQPDASKSECTVAKLRDILSEPFDECYEVSAKTGEGVEEAIIDMVERAVDKIRLGGHEDGHTEHYRLAGPMPKSKRSQCC